MASSVSNGNDRSEKWHRPFQMATTVYEREICVATILADMSKLNLLHAGEVKTKPFEICSVFTRSQLNQFSCFFSFNSFSKSCTKTSSYQSSRNEYYSKNDKEVNFKTIHLSHANRTMSPCKVVFFQRDWRQQDLQLRCYSTKLQKRMSGKKAITHLLYICPRKHLDLRKEYSLLCCKGENA